MRVLLVSTLLGVETGVDIGCRQQSRSPIAALAPVGVRPLSGAFQTREESRV